MARRLRSRRMLCVKRDCQTGRLADAQGLAIRPELVWGFRCQGDFFAGRPSSIAPIAKGRHDCGESVEVEIDNDLEGFAGGIVA